MRILLLILTCFVIMSNVSCNQTIDKSLAKEKLEALLNVSISENIEISNYDISLDIHGKYTEKFTVSFKDKEEYNNIFTKVKPSKSEYFDIYGYGVEYGNPLERGYKSISAVFNPQKQTIKYSYYEY